MKTAVIKISVLFILCSGGSYAQSLEDISSEQTNERGRSATQMPVVTENQDIEAEDLIADSTTVRQFHEVVDELLIEFAHDVKLGQINGLKNLSIRDVKVSESIPSTYEQYVELLVAERIRENSKIRLISCVPCKTKTSRLVEGKLMITSPKTNMDTLTRVADQLGIEYFMDVVMVYHATHMVLAFQVFNTSTKELVWARAYNSETVKSRYQKLAIDYQQVEKSRASDDYVPEYRTLLAVGGGSLPNIGGEKSDRSMLVFTARVTEKFNNRRDEFGLLCSLYKTTNSLINSYPTSGQVANSNQNVNNQGNNGLRLLPYHTALTLQGVYARNFLNAIESYNDMRLGVNVSGGFFIAKSYLAPIIRGGVDVYFGRRFAITPGFVYVAPSKVLLNDEYVKTNGGTGGEIALSFNF